MTWALARARERPCLARLNAAATNGADRERGVRGEGRRRRGKTASTAAASRGATPPVLVASATPSPQSPIGSVAHRAPPVDYWEKEVAPTAPSQSPNSLKGLARTPARIRDGASPALRRSRAARGARTTRARRGPPGQQP
eukprot:11354876-Alexandrium_andersonii.AAC.1